MTENLRIEALQQAVAIADASAKPEDIVGAAQAFYDFLSETSGEQTTPATRRGRPRKSDDAATETPATQPETPAADSKPPLDAGNANTAAASEQPAPSTAPVPPSDDLKTAAMKFSQANGHDAFVAALAKYSAAKLSEVPVDKRDALLADLTPKADTGGAFD